jgi:hypothetical protein
MGLSEDVRYWLLAETATRILPHFPIEKVSPVWKKRVVVFGNVGRNVARLKAVAPLVPFLLRCIETLIGFFLQTDLDLMEPPFPVQGAWTTPLTVRETAATVAALGVMFVVMSDGPVRDWLQSGAKKSAMGLKKKVIDPLARSVKTNVIDPATASTVSYLGNTEAGRAVANSRLGRWWSARKTSREMQNVRQDSVPESSRGSGRTSFNREEVSRDHGSLPSSRSRGTQRNSSTATQVEPETPEFLATLTVAQQQQQPQSFSSTMPMATAASIDGNNLASITTSSPVAPAPDMIGTGTHQQEPRMVQGDSTQLIIILSLVSLLALVCVVALVLGLVALCRNTVRNREELISETARQKNRGRNQTIQFRGSSCIHDDSGFNNVGESEAETNNMFRGSHSRSRQTTRSRSGILRNSGHNLSVAFNAIVSRDDDSTLNSSIGDDEEQLYGIHPTIVPGCAAPARPMY